MTLKPTGKARFNFEVGLIYRREVRNSLKEISFNNPEFTWLETKHFLTSEFTVRGPTRLVKAYRDLLVERIKDVQSES